MDFGENLICDKIMFSKYSPLPKRLVKDCCPVGRRVIVRQRGFSTRIAVILSEKRNAVSLVDAGFRLPERHGADISGIEDGPGFQTFLTKKDRERIKLLPCAASGNPRSEEHTSELQSLMRN